MSELKLRGRNLEWRDVDGEVVALDVSASTYLATNRTGAELWRALAAGSTGEGLADLLVDRYGVGKDQALADVEAFVNDLMAQGLLE